MSTSSCHDMGKRSARSRESSTLGQLLEDDLDSGSEEAVARTRSSARHVSRVIAKFDEHKRKLVEDIGFGGILHLPQLNKVNRRFSLWLFSRIDVARSTLLLRDNVEVPLSGPNVHKVLGIPNGSRPVYPLGELDEKKFVEMCLGIPNGSVDGLKEASAIVEKVHPDGMNRGDEMVFQSAFVIFVMGHFLAPTTQHDVGMVDFLGATTDVDELEEFDWCGYVINKLVASAKKVQADLNEGKQLTYVTGCPLLLQILYLDCMDFGPLNQKHDLFPRMKAFWHEDGSCKLMNQMIVRDTAGSSTSYGDQAFGCSKVRPIDTLCYELSFTAKFVPSVPHGMEQASVINEPIDLSSIVKVGASDLMRFLKRKYGDLLTSEEADALKFHNARCLQHINKMKNSMLKENIMLADKLLTIQKRKDIAKRPRVNVRTQREEYLSGPDSGSEDEFQHRNKRKSFSCTEQQASTPRPRKTYPTKSYRYSRSYRKPYSAAGWGWGGNIETILSGPSMPCQGATNRNESMNFDTSRTTSATEDKTEFPEFCAQPFQQTPVTPNQPLPSIAEEISPCKQASPTENVTDPNAYSGNNNRSPAQFDVSNLNKTDAAAPVPENVPDAAIPNPTQNHIAIPKPKNGVDQANAFSVQTDSLHTPLQSSKTSTASNQMSPASLNKNYSSALLWYKITREEDDLNLNATPTEEEYSKSLVKKNIMFGSGSFARSPWDCKLRFNKVDEDLSDSLFDWLRTTSSKELSRAWLMHQGGSFIEITGSMMKDQFCKGFPMNFDMLDVSARRLRQLDSDMYPEGLKIRWRHWVESDFAMTALAGDDPSKSFAIKEQFIGKNINYAIIKCRMFIIPLQTKDNWCAYVWDMKKKKRIIIDPTLCGESVATTMSKHIKTVDELHKGFSHTLSELFDGWAIDWKDWHTEVPSCASINVECVGSGLCTLFLARNYDGDKYVTEPSEDNLNAFRKSFLYELMDLRDNHARVPGIYVQTIQD